MKETATTIANYLTWRADSLPCKLTSKAIRLIVIQHFLSSVCLLLLQNTGFAYVHGRDKYFRPCLVLDSSVVENIRGTELFDGEVIAQAGVFILEYVRQNMFLHGQVENWVVINNVSKLSLNKLPRKEMQNIMWLLQNNFRQTLGHAWAVNATAFQTLCWKVFEIFIDE